MRESRVPKRERRSSRPLTDAEWGMLSPGLAAALRAEAINPRIVNRAHPAALIAGLWRGGTPILTRGAAIWWPGAQACFARHPAMAILQHELQHVLEYATGELTALGYLTHPRNWTYAWRPGAPWKAYGAEQRASMVEDMWRMEHGLADPRDLPALRQLIPWAET